MEIVGIVLAVLVGMFVISRIVGKIQEIRRPGNDRVTPGNGQWRPECGRSHWKVNGMG